MKIIESFLTNNPCYKENKKIAVKGLMLHSVGCPQPSASVFIKNWNKSTYDRACVHAFIDANDGNTYQTLHWNTRGWHCGGKGNDTHIGVEMCEPSTIKYVGGSRIECTNKASAIQTVKKTYESAVLLFAMLCEKFGLNPLTDIISHKEGGEKGIASGHADPEHLWTQLGLPYSMNTFRKDVKSKMKTTIVKPKSIIGDEDVWNFLKSKGLNDYAVAGIMGNLYAESGIRSNNLQNSYETKLKMTDEEYTSAIDNGTYTEDQFINDHAGYGLAQWTYWSRKKNLYDFIKSNPDNSIGDLTAQLNFFWTELLGYKDVYNTLLNARSVSEASDVMVLKYERPANQSEENLAKRSSYGLKYYNRFSKHQNGGEIPQTPFLVKVAITNLNIRKGPGLNYDSKAFINIGTYTIVEVQSGIGSIKGWGKLKSGVGWIALDYCEIK